MPVDRARIELIFDAACSRPTAAERDAYLDGACAGDATLREQVDSLLRAHDQAGSFLKPPAPQETLAAPHGALQEGPGTTIGRYKLLQLIGEGGFGLVFMAEQERPVRRKVALKIIKLGMDTRQVVARFEAERQALAMMDHPNIAKVFDAGATETGRPYFVMELVRGIPITQYCDESNLTTRDRLDLFILVCKAVQHAHQKGIIHRDLKPSNVLVTLHDDKPVPKVIDFGIAKATQARLTEKTLFTEFRQFIGTPQYMAPEQAQMSGLDIDTRSDVYSLGVLLYELLTGTTPLDAKELCSAAYEQMQRMIREVEPPRPSTRLSTMGQALTKVAGHRRIDPSKLPRLVRGELDWIVMKALEKDRTRRYETANGLALDVQRYLNDETVSASPPSHWYALRKTLRRYRGPVAAAGFVAIAVIIGLAGATWGMLHAVVAQRREAEQRHIAEEKGRIASDALDRAEHSRRDAEMALASIYPNNGLRASDAGQDALACLWFANASRLAGAETEAGRLNARRATSWAASVLVPVAAVTIPGQWTQEVQVHRAGRYLLARTLEPSSTYGDATCTLWDLYNETQVPLPSDLGAVTAATWNPDGTRIALGNAAGEVRIMSFPEFERVQTGEVNQRVNALTFDASGQRLAIAGGTAAVVWDCAAQKPATPMYAHPAAVASVSFSPNGQMLLTACWDQKARVFRVGLDGAEPVFATVPHALRPFAGAERPVMPSFFGDGLVVTASNDGLIWSDARDGHMVRTLPVPDGVRCLNVLSHSMVVAGGAQIQWIDDAGKISRSVQKRGTTCMAICPDQRLMASGAGSGVSLVWNTSIQMRLNALPEHSSAVSGLAFSPDARFAVSVEHGGLTRVWAMPLVPLKASLSFSGYLSLLHFSADEAYVVPSGGNFSEGDMRATRVFSEAGEPAGPPMDAGAVIRCAALSSTGHIVTLLTTDNGKPAIYELQTWDWRAGRRLTSVPLPGYPESLSLSPDGKHIAVVCFNAEAMLVDAAGGAVRRRWPSGRVVVRPELLDSASCFSPDGGTLITFDSDALQVRDAMSGELRFPPMVCGSAWTGASFSHDGQYFATTNANSELCVRETASGKQPSPAVHTSVGRACPRFSPDDRYVLTSTGGVEVWDWRAARLLFPPMARLDEAAWLKDGTILANGETGISVFDGRDGAELLQLDPGNQPVVTTNPAGSLVAPLGISGRARILSTDEPALIRPVGDVSLFGEVVAAQRITADGAVLPLERDEWLDRWRRYRSAVPGPSPLARLSDQAVAFHRQKAADIVNPESSRLFHLDRLLEAGVATPGERLERARFLAGSSQWDKAADALADAMDRSGYDADALQDYVDLQPAMSASTRAAEQFNRFALANPEKLNGLIRGKWWVLGPLPLEQNVTPDSDARKSVGASSWRMTDSNQPFLDLGTAIGVQHFIQARIYCPREQDVLLNIVLDDGGQSWLNGEKIYDLTVGWKKPTAVLAHIHVGWNTLLARVTNQNGVTTAKIEASQDPLALGSFYLDQPADGLAKSLAYLDKAVEQRPGDAGARAARGNALARFGRFAQASADFAAALDLNPDDERTWMQSALLKRYLGDVDGYRHAKYSFVSRFQDSTDSTVVEHLACTLAMDLDPDPMFDVNDMRHAYTLVENARRTASPAQRPYLQMVRGMLCYRTGQFSTAISALEDGRAHVNLPANEALDDLFLAMAHYRGGQQDLARTCLTDAVKLIDEKVAKAGVDDLTALYEVWLCCRIVRAEAESLLTGETAPEIDWNARRKQRRDWAILASTQQIDAHPGLAANYFSRAALYVRGSQFAQAAADFARAAELDPDGHFNWYFRGCLLAYLNDRSTYDSNRSATLNRFRGTKDHDTAERIAKAALLMPIDPDELRQAAALIDFSLSPGAGESAKVWYPLAKGMVEYRLGESQPAHLEIAIDWLTRAKQRNAMEAFRAAADFYLAMTFHRLHRDKEADDAFERAIQRAAKLPRAGVDDLQVTGNTPDWLVCQTARREAERTLGRNPAAATLPASTAPASNPVKW